jgi:hypothetical protein
VILYYCSPLVKDSDLPLPCPRIGKESAAPQRTSCSSGLDRTDVADGVRDSSCSYVQGWRSAPVVSARLLPSRLRTRARTTSGSTRRSGRRAVMSVPTPCRRRHARESRGPSTACSEPCRGGQNATGSGTPGASESPWSCPHKPLGRRFDPCRPHQPITEGAPEVMSLRPSPAICPSWRATSADSNSSSPSQVQRAFHPLPSRARLYAAVYAGPAGIPTESPTEASGVSGALCATPVSFDIISLRNR